MRNRVVEVRNVKASLLKANEKNWRLHPDGQREAMRSVLTSIGFVGTLIARDTPNGLEILDGHLRADLADDAEVPVAIVDLDDKEAEHVLATFDPLGDLALVDNEKLHDLLAGMDLQPHEHYDYLVVLASTTHEWNVLCEKLGMKPTERRRGKIGTARAIRATQLLGKLK